MRRMGTAGLAVAALCGTLLGYGGSPAGAATSANVLVPAGRLAVGVPPGSRDEGAAPAGALQQVEVVLAPSDPAGLAALLNGQYDAGSPLYHHWLTPSQFESRFGPSPATVAAASRWLAGRGLQAHRSSTFALSVTAPLSRLGSALGTRFHTYRTPSGDTGVVAQGAPLVPSGLQSQVTAITGLSSLAVFRPFYRAARPDTTQALATTSPAGTTASICPAAQTQESYYPSAWTMDQLRPAYGVDKLLGAGLQGTGQTVAVYELAQYQPSDVAAYMSCFHLTNRLTRVAVDGGGSIDWSGGTAEADLDIEQVMTQAPGASVIDYDAPNGGTVNGAYDVWARIVADDTAKVVSSSWGLCETDAYPYQMSGTYAYGPLFQQAAAQGQTILVASGDAGSEGCSYDYGATGWNALTADYPASDPNVTAVGGTDYHSATNETTWNDCGTVTCASNGGFQAAGGGGFSGYETRPSWQPAVAGGPTSSACAPSCREVPDISANAGVPMVDYTSYNDPYTGQNYSGWSAGLGTSYAAPFLAGLVADRNQGCQAPSGDIARTLYSLASTTAGYRAAFRDITTGNDDMLGAHNGTYAAGPGYDLATGLGAPVAQGLACAEVTSLSSTIGPAGSTVTVGGLGLEGATLYFGSTPVTPTATSATSATVVVPAGTGTVTVTAVSPAGAGTVGRSWTYGVPPAPAPSPWVHITTPTESRMLAAAGIPIETVGGGQYYDSTEVARVATPAQSWTLRAAGLTVFTMGSTQYYNSARVVRLYSPGQSRAFSAYRVPVFTMGSTQYYNATHAAHVATPAQSSWLAHAGFHIYTIYGGQYFDPYQRR
jgi:subtilase family serine protease